jgi:hypothetical protein
VLQIKSADAADVYLGASDGPAFTLQPLPYEFEKQDA